MATLTIPMRAIGKARPRLGRNGTYTPEATKAAQNQIGWEWAAAFSGPPLVGPIRLTIRAEYTPPASWSAKKRQAAMGTWKTTKPDFDNVAKLVGDALNNVAFGDDAQVADASIEKVFGPEDKIIITVESI